jgi:hypothetical protein
MAVSRERLDQLYNELFGRKAEDAGAEYWMGTGLTGEELRDNLIYAAGKAAEGERQDYNSYLARQAQLARGQTPAGYGPSVSQESLTAMQEELAALRELLAAQASSGYSGGSAPLVGQPGGGQPGMGQPPAGGVTGGGYSYTTPAAPPPMDNPYLAQLPSNPPVGYIPPTPEMLDAYRYQQFYNQIPPIDQGIGQLSYFGIPPSQIQASLSGF